MSTALLYTAVEVRWTNGNQQCSHKLRHHSSDKIKMTYIMVT